jgi:GNAT superfamily N-acetyltransferase
MPATPVDSEQDVSPLSAAQLDHVVAIDRAYTGRSRRRFFAKRFAAAEAHPDDFVLLGSSRSGTLRGFAIAHLLRGEFGREHIAAVLDALGVEAVSQDAGIGHRLIEELVAILQRRGVRLLHSQAKWTDGDLLRFFNASGFELSPRFVLERLVAVPLVEDIDEP